ncbi:MAG: hypothetical protein M3460_28700 [Actinomycetota bacterium]|nr:hypothetical protein [Actinomycetota bacterium]
MHVPLVYERTSGIGLANAAQIHFPREQIAELTAILDGCPHLAPRRSKQDIVQCRNQRVATTRLVHVQTHAEPLDRRPAGN